MSATMKEIVDAMLAVSRVAQQPTGFYVNRRVFRLIVEANGVGIRFGPFARRRGIRGRKTALNVRRSLL